MPAYSIHHYLIIILMIPLVFIILYNLYGILEFLYQYITSIILPQSYRFTHSKKHKIIERTLLSINFVYYLKLNDRKRNEFIYRIENFIEEKIFISREGFIIDDTVKIYVAACAIQITFGLDDYYLGHFKKIIIYPKEYYSKINKRYHKGEVNIGGAIILSWQDFLEGYKNNEDGRNLGLHEMAHALYFNNHFDDVIDNFFKHYIQRYIHLSKNEICIIRSGNHHIFRDYAQTNFNEFFAVSVEYFFEKPQLFSQELPILYKEMTILLNQNPLETDKIGTVDFRELLKIPDIKIINIEPIKQIKIYPKNIFLTFISSLSVFILLIIIFENINKSSKEYIFISTCIIFFSICSYLIQIKNIGLYENYIAIYSNFIYFRINRIIPYNNIISVHIDEHDDIDTDFMEIIYTNGKKICVYHIELKFRSKKNITDILEHLKTKNIHIKSSHPDYKKFTS